MYPRKSSSQIKPQKLATSILGIIGVIALISIGTLWHQRQSTLDQSTLDKLNRLKTNAERSVSSGRAANPSNSNSTLETYSLPTEDTLAGERGRQSSVVDTSIPLETPIFPRSASTPGSNTKFGGFSDSSPFTNSGKLKSSERKAANGFSPSIGSTNKSSYTSEPSSTVSPGSISSPNR